MSMKKTNLICYLLLLLLRVEYLSSQIKINEFLSSNITQLADEDGDYPDWVEFLNTSAETVYLGNYTFTDDINDTLKWTFPPVSVEPGAYQLVFTSGKNRLHLLNDWYTIIDQGAQFKYIIPDMEMGDEWKKIGFDDQSWLEGISGFGYGDADDATQTGNIMSLYVRKEFTISNYEDLVQMVLHMDYDDGFIAYINGIEVARANLGNPGDPVAYNTPADNNYHEARIYLRYEPDTFRIHEWKNIIQQGINVLCVEVHNYSLSSSDLSCIPILSLGLKTKGEYPVSEKINLPDSCSHTNFRISAGGESIYLFKDKVLVDSVGPTYLTSDISYGRQPDGADNWAYFIAPTPWAPNGENSISTLSTDSVIFSIPGGNKDHEVTLELSIQNNPTGYIYYTTDGSIPSQTSILYNQPIDITTDTVIRARAFVTGRLPAPVITQTYVLEHQHSFPIVCISTNPDNLWDYNTGIYAFGPLAETDIPYYGANFWQDWERPVHFEYYDNNGVKQIDQGAGIKIFGNWTKAFPQKSFALFARKEYGDGAFNYKFFQHRENDKFESLILRNAGNAFYYTHFHDVLNITCMSHIGIEHQDVQPTVVYLNGWYWGILNMREKINEHFLSDNLKVKTEEVHILEKEGEPKYGVNTRYLQLLEFINTNSLQSDANYDKVCKTIDVDNFIKYFLIETYIDNRDWPGNNIKFWNTSSIRSKYRWLLYDTDYSFGLGSNEGYKFNSIAAALSPNGPTWPNPPWSTLLFRKLVANSRFKQKFAQSGCDYLNSYWNTNNYLSKIDSFKTLYMDEMADHCLRWDLDYNNWNYEVNKLKTFASERPAYYWQYLGEAMDFDGNNTITLETFPASGGKIKLNSIVPNSYPFNGFYYNNIAIKLKAIPNPGYKFVRWEGDINSTKPQLEYKINQNYIHNAIFEASTEQNSDIVINEVFYKSSEELKPGDWVELYNNGETTVDLKGWWLSDTQTDSALVIPSSYLLAPDEYLVVCKDVEKFKTTYPWVINVIGEFDFGLSSAGDHIRLYNDENQLIDAVDYYPAGDWPQEANGLGASIELTHPNLLNEDGKNWFASLNGGTPGMQNISIVDIGITNTKNNLNAHLSCSPNPFSRYANINFSIKEAGNYTIDLIGINGYVIKNLNDDFYTQGNYTIKLKDSDIALMTRGVFLIRLLSESGLETIKIIKQ